MDIPVNIWTAFGYGFNECFPMSLADYPGLRVLLSAARAQGLVSRFAGSIKAASTNR